MSSLRRALIALAAAGLAVGVGSMALALGNDRLEYRTLTIVSGLLVGWSFIGTGLYAWWRRPHNRFGALMTAVGFASFLGAPSVVDSDLAFTIGFALSSLVLSVFVHMVVAYPHGRVEHPVDRRLVVVCYALTIVGPLGALLFADFAESGCPECPDSVIRVADSASAAFAVADPVFSVLVVAVALAVLWRLLVRWRASSALGRRAQAPVLWSGVALLVLLAGSVGSDAIGASGATGLFTVAAVLALVTTPFGFLLGLLRSRVARAGAVSELLTRLGAEPSTANLRELLAEALGDPSLELVYWLEAERTWVTVEGHPVALPADPHPGRTWTAVERDGRRVGALVHDRSLCEDPELIASVAATAGLAVENERLGAQLRARVEQLHASRARIVEAGTAERRRLERDLHDGAQQRLVALSLTLRLAQGRLPGAPEAAAALLDSAQEELHHALAELRELARGIHPAVLSDRGLDAALEALAGRSPVPIAFEGVPPERLPAPVEAAAYFVVAEALTNVAKYAGASEARVRVERRDGTAIVEVSDDGVGGADPGRGSGLRGLADRLSALDGRLDVASPPGQGTRLRAEIPV